jgi:hypothetical protein
MISDSSWKLLGALVTGTMALPPINRNLHIDMRFGSGQTACRARLWFTTKYVTGASSRLHSSTSAEKGLMFISAGGGREKQNGAANAAPPKN